MRGHALWFILTLALAASLVYCVLAEWPDAGCTADLLIMVEDSSCAPPEFHE